jgi:hypothetical protein
MDRIVKRSSIVIGGLCIGVLGIYTLFTNYPPSSFVYIPCIFHFTTGLHCPGCGATRAVSSFMHGNIVEGLRNNLLILLWGPYLFYRSCIAILTWIDGKNRTAWSPPIQSIYLFFALTIAFTILRNLPFEPFISLFSPIE